MFEGFETLHRAPQGVDIHARRAGSGPPLLLLHGHPQTQAMWHRVAPTLAHHCTVVLADLRGYGDSARVAPDAGHHAHSKRVMARDMLGLMQSLGHERFAVLAHDRASAAAAGDDPEHDGVRGEIRLGTWLLTVAVGLVLVLGTVVTGTGPHSGDREVGDRLPFDLETVTQVHADLVFLVVGLTIGLLLAVRSSGARSPTRPLFGRLAALLGVVLAQGAVGYAQYVTDLPVLLVGIHVLGACLVWIATVRTLLATMTRPGLRPVSPVGSHPEPAWAGGR